MLGVWVGHPQCVWRVGVASLCWGCGYCVTGLYAILQKDEIFKACQTILEGVKGLVLNTTNTVKDALM